MQDFTEVRADEVKSKLRIYPYTPVFSTFRATPSVDR